MNSLTFSKKSDADATFHQEIVFLKKTYKQTNKIKNKCHARKQYKLLPYPTISILAGNHLWALDRNTSA